MKKSNVSLLFLMLGVWFMAPLGNSFAGDQNITNLPNEGSSIQTASRSDAPRKMTTKKKPYPGRKFPTQ